MPLADLDVPGVAMGLPGRDVLEDDRVVFLDRLQATDGFVCVVSCACVVCFMFACVCGVCVCACVCVLLLSVLSSVLVCVVFLLRAAYVFVCVPSQDPLARATK